jgi:Zn-dependent M32 family carboxypeptidase
MYDTPDLIRRATGRPLSADALVRHLTRVVDGA